MGIQEIVNMIYHDDIIVISSDDAILWSGRAAEYRGEIDEGKYRLNCIQGLSDGYVGINVYSAIDD